MLAIKTVSCCSLSNCVHVLKIFGSLMSCCNYAHGEYFIRMLVSLLFTKLCIISKCLFVHLYSCGLCISLEKGLLLPFVTMQMWIAKSEYDESGPSIVHRKCF